ncbi:MAG: DUF1611 domain-containing protein [Bacteroidota bacterium]
MTFEPPYLLFLGDQDDPHHMKPGQGLHDWAPERCLGQYRLEADTVSLGLPDLTPTEAVAQGARTMVLALANVGGFIDEAWHDALVEAVEAGLDLVSGMHARLSDVPRLAEAAKRHGRRLIDVRHADVAFGTGTGEPRSGHRVLTVGTDCVVGKKYTALSLTRALREAGVDADFRATGQTGIMIAGRGVAVDAVKSDFLSGAAEWLAPANEPDHWDLIEGQGSLFHPAYAAVSLGLLHGAQPEAIVLCHAPGRSHIQGFPRYPIPPIATCIERILEAGRLTSPRVRCAGISLNTAALSDAESDYALKQMEDAHGLPCVDPVRQGAGRLAEALLHPHLAS